jgi:prephenate dehydratase
LATTNKEVLSLPESATSSLPSTKKADQSKDIAVIYAHQQALEQCQRWLKNHYPKAQLKSVASNALAARLVKDEPNAAAIASEVALGLYGLERVGIPTLYLALDGVQVAIYLYFDL